MRFSTLWMGALSALSLVALFAQALVAAEIELLPSEGTDSPRSIQRLTHALASKFGVESDQVFFVPAAQATEKGEFLIRGYNIICKDTASEVSPGQVHCVDSRGERVGGLTTAEYTSAVKPVLR